MAGDGWRRIHIGSTDFLDFRTCVTSFYKLTVGLFYHIVLISGQMFITLQRYEILSKSQLVCCHNDISRFVILMANLVIKRLYLL